MTAVRWFLALLSVPLVLAVGAAIGWIIVQVADGRCPQSSQVGGACVAAWHTTAVDWAVYVGVIVSAFAVVLIPPAIAPAARNIMAVVGFLLVAGVAVFGLVSVPWPEVRLPLGVATACALAGVLVMWRRRANV